LNRAEEVRMHGTILTLERESKMNRVSAGMHVDRP